MRTHKVNYPNWGYQQAQELLSLCRQLPLKPRDRAVAFFDAAERVTEDSREPAEWAGDILFGSLGSTLAASDRPDCDVEWFEAEGAADGSNIADGVLTVETFDPVTPTLQCVVRVSDDSFMTRVFSFDDVAAVKRLVAPSTSDVGPSVPPNPALSPRSPQAGTPTRVAATSIATGRHRLDPFRRGRRCAGDRPARLIVALGLPLLRGWAQPSPARTRSASASSSRITEYVLSISPGASAPESSAASSTAW